MSKNLEKDMCLDVFKKEGMILELMNLLPLKFKKLAKRKVQRWFVSTVYIKRWTCNHLEATIMVNKRVWNAVLGCNLKNNRMIFVRFQGKPFNVTVIQVYAPTTDAKEADIDLFYEEL